MSSEGDHTNQPQRDKAQREADRAAFAQSALLFNGKRIETAEEACGFLGQPVGKLTYLLYRAPEEQRYTPFEIPKRTGGMRLIHSPNGAIREAQEALAPHLLALYNAHPSVHGFIKE